MHAATEARTHTWAKTHTESTRSTRGPAFRAGSSRARLRETLEPDSYLGSGHTH